MSNKARANFLRYTCSGVGIGSLDRRGPANPRPRHRCLPPRLLLAGGGDSSSGSHPHPPPGDGGTPHWASSGALAAWLAAPWPLRLTAAVHTRVSPPSPLSCPAARLLLSGDPCPAPLPCCSATHHRAPWLAPFRAGVAEVGTGWQGHMDLCYRPPCPRGAPSPASPSHACPIDRQHNSPFPVCVPSTQPFLTRLEVYRCYLSSSFI